MFSNRVEDLVSKMTLKEKIGQMCQIHPSTYYETKKSKKSNHELTGMIHKDVDYNEEDIYSIGSMLTVDNAEESIALQKDYIKNHRLSIPLLFMYDVIHGYKTIFPINLGLSSSWNTELVKECSNVAAIESSVSGVHVTFAPMCDLVRDPRWGRVMESPGEDPYLIGCMSKATVEGFQQDDFSTKHTVATCVKHFAAYGAAEAGRDYNIVDISERWLREYYLKGYKAAIDAGSKMVMTSFNVYDSVPATLNDFLMQDILRDEFGFNGVLISDWNAVIESLVIGGAEDKPDCARKALKAGLDIEMTSTVYYQTIEEQVKLGNIFEEAIDLATKRILQLKEDLGLFDHPYRFANRDAEKALHLCDKHKVIARKAAEESCVLLKNNGVLPFSKEVNKIAIIGPLADTQDIMGWWRAGGKSEHSVSLKTGIKNILDSNALVTAVEGCGYIDTDTSQFDEAIETAKDADIVILALGEQQDMCGEAGCRGFIGLPGCQQDLAEAIFALNKPTAVVLFNGRPLTLDWLDHHSPAILDAWFPGTEGGNAIANILFGDVNPSGKITMTFPRFLGQVPVYYNTLNVGRPIPKENYEHGKNFTPENRYHSNFLDIPNNPLYPFGYGLSYTTFSYTNLALSSNEMTAKDTLTCSVTVSNTGELDGTEVVQLYIQDVAGSVARPLKELKGFEKIHLNAGESKIITFEITSDMLKFYRKDMTFGVEPGTFNIYVGTNSRDVQTVSFKFL